ncbi:A24 family peptidase [Paenibacillus cisolokensis]|uniref:prepilin peptidase n=1 Tax=Paenibacillus cisolokensis TaxID=1658519 RepID=UPI003D2929BD
MLEKRFLKGERMNYTYVQLSLFLILGIATYTDLRWRIIPDWLTINALGCMLLIRLFISDQSHWHYFSGLFVASGVLYIAALLIPGSVGGGDIKLMAVVGVAIGWQESLLFLCLMFTIAGVCAVFVMMITKNRKMKIPMAPFFLISQTLLFAMG